MIKLEEHGFDWDSSLMGRDFEPYRPQSVTAHREEPSEFGPPSPVLELPVSWFVDDFPALDHVPGVLAGLMSTDDTFARWRDNFDYAYENHPGGVLTHTVHGLVSGARTPSCCWSDSLFTRSCTMTCGSPRSARSTTAGATTDDDDVRRPTC